MSRNTSHAIGKNVILAGCAALVIFAAAVGIGVAVVLGDSAAITSSEESVSSTAQLSSAEEESVSEAESETTEASSETAESSSDSTSVISTVQAAVSTVQPAASASQVPVSSSQAASSQASASSSQAVASSQAPVSSSQAAASSSSSAAASVSQAAKPTGSITGVFDSSVMGSSGYSNISSYRQINSDVMGWLKIPGTNINYPVLYNGNDVNYYLTKDLYKQYSKNGVIWADPATYFGNSANISDNTVLYGHNWTNYSANPHIGYSSDVMFAQLTQYHYLDFAKQYPYIYYSTEDEEMTWVIFACFYTDTNFVYNIANPDTATFSSIISGAKARSRHIIDVDVDTSDKILTLSTCTRAYGKSDRQRFVVMARLLRPGESIKAISMSSNPSPVLPNL